MEPGSQLTSALNRTQSQVSKILQHNAKRKEREEEKPYNYTIKEEVNIKYQTIEENVLRLIKATEFYKRLIYQIIMGNNITANKNTCK